MQLDMLVMPLLRAPLFMDMTTTQLKTLALGAERVSFRAGEALITAGEPGEAAFLVVSGEVSVKDGAAEVDRDIPLGMGTLVGEMAMLVETVHSTTVVADTPVRALMLSRSGLAELMASEPSIAEHIGSRLQDRIDELVDMLKRVGSLLRLDEAMAQEAVVEAAH